MFGKPIVLALPAVIARISIVRAGKMATAIVLPLSAILPRVSIDASMPEPFDAQRADTL
jgi:hypothetical protein